MNDVLKNVDLFISILGMSRSIEVQKWDKEAFQRAFRWAQYFEQVSIDLKIRLDSILLFDIIWKI